MSVHQKPVTDQKNGDKIMESLPLETNAGTSGEFG